MRLLLLSQEAADNEGQTTMKQTPNALYTALVESGRAVYPHPNATDATLRGHGNLDAAIAAIGGARGLCYRGRLVVTAPDAVFAYDAHNLDAYATEPVVYEFATVGDAEAFARRERTGDAQFRRAAAAVAEQANLDGPTGHGW